MAQQFHGSGHHQSSVTFSDRDTPRYAIVNPPFQGKHLKPQDKESLSRRKLHWAQRNGTLPQLMQRISTES